MIPWATFVEPEVARVGLNELEAKEKDIPYEYRDHAWFTCFAPAVNPEIVVTVLVEHGLHGGSASAPIAAKILNRYFADKKAEQERKTDEPEGGGPAPPGGRVVLDEQLIEETDLPPGVVNIVTGLGAGLRSGGSGALGLVDSAAGRLDAYLELHINSWDAAAAIVIAREAGCWTNDFDSGDWLASGNPIGVGSPALGSTLAALLKA